MTDFEYKVLAELMLLRQMVEGLRTDYSIARIVYFENLPPAAVVGTDYVAFRFGCSESAVIRGRFETNQIPRLREKPVAFVKRDVDAIWLNLSKSVPDKAAKYRHDIKNNMEKKNEKNKRN